MTGAPLFSILVPVYDVEEYLDDCLASVEAQDYRDFELILADDGSRDRSAAVCDAFAASHSYCFVTHTLNQGPYLARFECLKRSSGRYLVFLDADDMLHPDALRRLADCIERFAEPDIIRYKFSYDPSCLSSDDHSGVPAGCYSGSDTGIIMRASALGRMNSLWCMCVRRELFAALTPDSLLKGLRYAEDWMISARFIGEAASILVTDDILYYYRMRETSAVHSYHLGTVRQYERAWPAIIAIGEDWGGEYPALFRRGLAAEAAAGIVRLTTLAAGAEDFDTECDALRDLILSLRIDEAGAESLAEHYHMRVIRLFLKKKLRPIRTISRVYFGLKRYPGLFRKLKSF